MLRDTTRCVMPLVAQIAMGRAGHGQDTAVESMAVGKNIKQSCAQASLHGLCLAGDRVASARPLVQLN